MEITISGKDRERLKQVEELAKKLGLKISHQKQTGYKRTSAPEKETSDKLYQLMEEMAAYGAFKSIKDPIAWQREQRKDRPLPGRDK